MIRLQVLMAFLSPFAHSASLDSEEVAQALLPLLEQTVSNLDRNRLRHLKGELSSFEISVLTAGERARFETSALRVFREHHIDGKKTLAEFHKDPLMRDVREVFRSYSSRKISLEALMRSLIHERVTVEAFLNDPDLGYGSFQGFFRSSN